MIFVNEINKLVDITIFWPQVASVHGNSFQIEYSLVRRNGTVKLEKIVVEINKFNLSNSGRM